MSETNIMIKCEYLELVNLLNTGNKLQNEKTEVKFFIESFGLEKQLFAGIDEKQKLLLCASPKNYWVVPKNTQFINLAIFICNLLNSQKSIEPQALSQLIRNSIFFYV